MRKILLLALLMIPLSVTNAHAQFWLTVSPNCDMLRTATPANVVGTVCLQFGDVFRMFKQPYPTKVIAVLTMVVATAPWVCPAGTPGGPFTIHESTSVKLDSPPMLFGTAAIVAANSQTINYTSKQIDYNGNRSGGVVTSFSPWRCLIP